MNDKDVCFGFKVVVEWLVGLKGDSGDESS